MEILRDVVTYILSFKAYVMLPIIIFAFALVFRLKLSTSIKSSLTIGIGFIGIFVIFDFFVGSIGPCVKALILKNGLNMNALDVGWPPLASIAWSFKLAPILIIIILIVNFIMLFLKLTRIVNIDIWNFWHFIMVGTLVDSATKNILLVISSVIITEIITLKISDWCSPQLSKFANLSGITVSTFSALTYYPFGVIGNKIIDKVPVLNKINANPESIKRKLGLAGEPIIIGFIIGLLLGFGAGYEIKKILELAFSISAVILILPTMCGILTQGLLPISEGMKNFVQKKFPDIGQTYIGLDVAIIMGNTSVIVTGLLLMPLVLLFAFSLPGITFIPIGDLVNTMGLTSMIIVATNGNVVRSFLIGIPLVIGNLYVASNISSILTDLASKANLTFGGYQGLITSFNDGGNPLRFWIYKVFSGDVISMLFIPLIVFFLIMTYYFVKKDRSNLE